MVRRIRRFPLTEGVDQLLCPNRVGVGEQHGFHSGQRSPEIGGVLLFCPLEITPRVLSPLQSIHGENDVRVHELGQDWSRDSGQYGERFFVLSHPQQRLGA